MKKITGKYLVLGIYLLLAAIGFLIYAQLLHHQFIVYDDDAYVTENQHVKTGFTRENVIWAFTSGLTANWIPLTWLSHMLDCQLFDLKPQWHHFTNLLLHIINTLLLFAVLRQMTSALWQSAFVAAAFALHPLHVESVAWVSERKDVLSALFWILTMAAYLRYVRYTSIKWYLLTLLLFAMGLMAKPMLVTLPFVLLLLDYWPLDRFKVNGTARLIREKIPFLVLSAVSSVITFLVQQSAGAVSKIESIPLLTRLANAFVSYMAYIEKMVWPSRLAVLYPYPVEGLPMQRLVTAVLLLLGISFWVIHIAKNSRYLLVGWLWYLGTLVPVIGLIQVGNQSMADRYTYLPSIGIFIMIAWGISEISVKWRFRKILLCISSVAVLSAFSICTYFQLHYWRNGITLFERAIAVTENNFVMHYNLGVVFSHSGELDKAIEHYTKAVQIKRNYADAHYNLGVALKLQNKSSEALWHYRQVLLSKPDYIEAQNNIGVILAEQGKLNEAIVYYQKALKIKPDYAEAHYNLGRVLQSQNKLDEALGHYHRALQSKPDKVEVYNNIGIILKLQDRLAEAADYYSKALQIKPDYGEAHCNLGNVFAQQGKFDDAINQFNQALQSKADYPEAHYGLASCYVQLGQYKPAIVHWNKVLELEPNSAGTLNNLAWTLAANADAAVRNPADAVRFAEKACVLTQYSQPAMLDTLAAAYAASGQFLKAVETAEKAVQLAKTGDKNLAGEIQKRLQLYKAGQPYVEPPPETAPK
jgi:tetratricopeptide (TPR) repeat protein